MSRYRNSLPQLQDQLFLTDGGLETTLVFHHGIDLPAFAAFDLLKDDRGTRILEQYFEGYAEIASRRDLGFIYESATWRANPDWASTLGYGAHELDTLNQKAILLLHRLRERVEATQGASAKTPLIVSGCVGPRDDGYNPANVMTGDEAEAYHSVQIASFDNAGVDMVSAVTMTNVPESIGVVRAASARGIPVSISFTVETDGCLPTGESLSTAIQFVDDATEGSAAYYMVNCAHPTHFEHILDGGEWTKRIRGIRANASKCSHAELDEAETLDDGDPREFGDDYRRLLDLLPNVNVVGGCCGTDQRHVDEVAAALSSARGSR